MKTINSKRLEGQVAVVTGSSSGIGQGIAIAMAREGARILINYHSDEAGANATKEQIEAAGGKAIIVKADVAKEAEVQQMFGAAIKEFGTIDILVNNAGIQADADLVDMTLEQWQKVLDTNLTGPFLCAKAATKEFVKRGVRQDRSTAAGKIIFISSVHDIIPWAGRVNYTTSKGGLKMMMESIAQELGQHKIRVNCVSPGAIKTPINEAEWKDEEGERKMLSQIPYGRIGEPEDIAKAVRWLASDEADYITGTTIYVDGGMTLYPSFAQ